MAEAVIVSTVRTPIGRVGGALATVRPDDLAARVVAEAVRRAGVPPEDIDEVVLGCANQAGEDNRNVARMSVLLAGLPVETAGVTVNRLCASGLEAVASATRSLLVGEADALVAGGVESMSRAPWALAKPERAFPRGPQRLEDTALGWRFVNPEMARLGHTDSLGQTAEHVAREYDVTREQQDRFALQSHQRATRAQAEGRFQADLLPIEADGRLVEADESPRPDSSLEALAKLRPVFAADGSVTAGNSSPLNDGAAALTLVEASYARTHGLRPRARVLGAAVAGVAPRVMGIGPIPAVRKLLRRLDCSLDDVAVIELNEAFASQAVAVCRELGVDPADERLNPNGGAIALGHPLGCSGARLTIAALAELERRDARLGLVTMCIGVGQGMALMIERIPAS